MPRPVVGAGLRLGRCSRSTAGAIHELGVLNALQPRHLLLRCRLPHLRGLTDCAAVFPAGSATGGFLGRVVPASCPELALPARVADWSDDHYLRWLTQRGADCVSDLIVGAAAFERYLQSLKARQTWVQKKRATIYSALATEVMTRGMPGSSAHGEHPKFTALVDHGDRRLQVIVEVSPPMDSQVGQRWADLLVAEHLAHVHLITNGVAAARSGVSVVARRCSWKYERFDRVGEEGRVGVVSLLAVDAARFGMLDSWSRAAVRLANHRLLRRPMRCR